MSVQRIEADIRQLPLADQLYLMERLARRIREQAVPSSSEPPSETEKERLIAAMAQDPDVQRELRSINAEFAGTEWDGLDEAA